MNQPLGNLLAGQVMTLVGSRIDLPDREMSGFPTRGGECVERGLPKSIDIFAKKAARSRPSPTRDFPISLVGSTIFWISCAVSLGPIPATAQTDWVLPGPTPGSWFNSANWNNGVPAPTGDA